VIGSPFSAWTMKFDTHAAVVRVHARPVGVEDLGTTRMRRL
jgi:hypothetical protein